MTYAEMTTFLFWNIGGNQVAREVSSLCKRHNVDVLILAENKISDVDLLKALNENAESNFFAPFHTSSRVQFFLRYPPSSIEAVYDEGGIAIRRLRPPVGAEVLVAGLHLPSKMFENQDEQSFYSVRVSQAIHEAELSIGHSNTIIIGDLNMDPFEPGVVAGDGLHGVMTKTLALRRERVVRGRSRKFFYNPMWGLMGDRSDGPPGTYYYAGGNISYFWHTFDQVMIRPELLEYFVPENLQVIDEIDQRPLVLDGRIDTSISDHLPIIVTLNLEKGPSQ